MQISVTPVKRLCYQTRTTRLLKAGNIATLQNTNPVEAST